MPELGFLYQSSATSASASRHASPDSVFFTLDHNFALFSSASANVDPCSFTPHAHDQNRPVSDLSLHLAGHEEQESSSGPDLDPSPNPNNATMHIKRSLLSRNGEKAKVHKEGNKGDTDEPLDSARSSFSVALKECQDRRSRSEALLKKPDRRRPASLDLNNATSSSPRLGAMKKSSVSARKSGTFLSPATPYYRQASAGMQKGWSSERVPLHMNASRNNLSTTAAMLPYNNGRTLPSKWEDAERWIFSPVSGDSGARPSVAQPHRRPKSKSGPLGPPGIAYYSLYSPIVPMFDGVNMGNSIAGSPFSAGVIAADGLTIRSVGCGGAFPAYLEPCMARSVSVHGCSEMQNQVSLPHSLDRAKDVGINVSRVVSRRDVATQMSPVGSTNSSPKGRISSASNPSALSIVELQSDPSSKLEVRDVQVDERITVTRWSKKHRVRVPVKGENVDDWKQKEVNTQSPAWNFTDTSKSLSKENREEAKIIAWENLQKAKAEAAIRKLEMKLEKKRSSSMDKIMNKLRSAQKKAQKMRSSVITNQTHEAARPSNKIVSFRRTHKMGSLSGCFTCHAF